MSLKLVRACASAPFARAFSTSRGSLNEAFDASAKNLTHFVEYLQTPPRLRALLYDPSKAERVTRLRIANPKFKALTGSEKRKLSDEEYYLQPRTKGDPFPPRELELNAVIEASLTADTVTENLPKIRELIVDLNSGYQEYLTTNHLINLLSKFAELNQTLAGVEFVETKHLYFLGPLLKEEVWITQELASSKPKFALLASRIELQKVQLFTNLLRYHHYAQNGGANVSTLLAEISRAETLEKKFTAYNFGINPLAVEAPVMALANSLLKYALGVQAAVPIERLQVVVNEIVARAGFEITHTSNGYALYAMKIFQDALATQGTAELTEVNKKVVAPYLQQASKAHPEELSAVVDSFETKFRFTA